MESFQFCKDREKYNENHLVQMWFSHYALYHSAINLIRRVFTNKYKHVVRK
jgi:hypothetical protein